MENSDSQPGCREEGLGVQGAAKYYIFLLFAGISYETYQ